MMLCYHRCPFSSASNESFVVVGNWMKEKRKRKRRERRGNHPTGRSVTDDSLTTVRVTNSFTTSITGGRSYCFSPDWQKQCSVLSQLQDFTMNCLVEASIFIYEALQTSPENVIFMFLAGFFTAFLFLCFPFFALVMTTD